MNNKAYISILLLLYLLAIQSVHAGKSSVSNILKRSEILNNPVTPLTILLKDISANDESANPSKYYIKGRTTCVRLLYKETGNTYANGNWKYRITYTITGDNNEKTIEISKDDIGGKFETIHRYPNNLSEAHVTITSVTASNGGDISNPATSNLLPDGIVFEVSIETERYTLLSSIDKVNDLVYNAATRKVSWSLLENAEEYELGWVFIDIWEQTYFNNSAEAFSFKQPVTVSVSSGEYTLDNLYSRGVLYFAVRPLGRDLDDIDQVVYGSWSYSAPYELSGVDLGKVWQYSSTYAEEGKHKAVATFYDGSLHSRQTVTNLSSNNLTLAVEAKYDYEGRKALDILPVPLQGNDLSYKNSLNRNLNGTVFDKANFDMNSSAPLNTQFGVGQYYSSNNTLTTPERNYIPDAEGYPFSRTQYMPDNTGRISSISGVGSMLKDGAGKETFFYYGTPTSRNLHTLFGSNVGHVSHYKKNLQIDANSQAYVTYLDQEGRTIATALSGVQPSNLTRVPDFRSNTVTVNLNDNNIVDPERYQSRSVNTILHTPPARNYNFEYRVNGNFSLYEYDLEITIHNAKGELVDIGYGGDDPKVVKIEGITSPLNVAFSVQFTDPGSYTITKTLTFNLAAAKKKLDALIQQNFSNELLEQITTEYKDAIDLSVCDNTCTSCTQDEINALIDAATSEECDMYKLDISPGGFHFEEDLSGSFWTNVQNLINNNTINANIQNEDGTIARITSVAQFKQGDWDETWNDELIKAHREYCHYQLCVSTTNSKIYNNRLYEVASWDAAMAKGYINPQGMQVTLNNGTTIPVPASSVMDPYINTSLQSEMLNYKGSGKNLWQVAIDISADPANANLAAEEKNELMWSTFRGGYTGLKRKIQLNTANCPYFDDDNARAKAEEKEVMNIQDEGGFNAYGDKKIAEYGDGGCSDNCGQSVLAWMAEKAEVCNFTWDDYPEQYQQVFDALYAKCAENCSSNNILGELKAEHISSAELDLPPCFNNSCEGYAHKMANKWMLKMADFQNLDWDAYPIEKEAIFNKLFSFFNVKCVNNDPKSDLTISDFYDLEISFPNCSSCDASCLFSPNSLQYSSTIGSTHLGFTTKFKQILDIIPNYLLNPTYSDYQCIENLYRKYYALGTSTYCNLKIMRNTDSGLGACFSKDCYAGYSVTFRIHDLNYDPDANMDANYVKLSLLDHIGNDFIYMKTLYGKEIMKGTFYYIDGRVENGYIVGTKLVELVTDYITYPSSIRCPQPNFYVDQPNGVSLDQFLLDRAKEECINTRIAEAKSNAVTEFNSRIEQFSTNFIQKCKDEMFNGSLVENLKCTYDEYEYHYTLYYYDQAGNLVQTVPPAGVDLNTAQFDNNGNYIGGEPDHKLPTVYRYDGLNNLVWQQTPDAGISQFWYDGKGRLRFSQDAKQAEEGTFSYTRYDKLNRITEVGQSAQDLTTCIASVDETNEVGSVFPNQLTQQVTHTYYDEQLVLPTSVLQQENLRNRVASVTISDNPASNIYDYATHYSYDIHGNVKTLIQDYPFMAIAGHQFKRIDYKYDLISNNVNEVIYQAGQPDLFIHKYEYDADNRITNVYTSTNGYIWDQDAKYFYYQHGPLARMEIGQNKVQGLDFAYTLQGWIKGVNSNTLKPNRDMGQDGNNVSGNPNARIGRDAFGYSLGYFDGDYKPIGTIGNNDNTLAAGNFNFSQGRSLYNGNISNMVTAAGVPDNFSEQFKPLLTSYTYDQLNRISTMTAYDKPTVVAENDWANAQNTNSNYNTAYSYDPNGNIQTLARNGAGSLIPMDNLTYNYHSVKKNQLLHINDGVTNSGYAEDIKDMGVFDAQLSNTWNYQYDAIGNLIKDKSQDIPLNGIQWNVYGKIKSVSRAAGSTKPGLSFGYDAAGNRISKTVQIPGDLFCTTTWYVRDATGNTMATYSYQWKPASPAQDYTLSLLDNSIYGSSRLGIYERNLNMLAAAPTEMTRVVGNKRYELANHLGNVTTVITDYGTSIDNGTYNPDASLASATPDGLIDFNKPLVYSSNNYYPFGSIMPGTSFNAPDYRYGFNGKEKDDEVKGSGVQYDYGFRIYDARIAKFLSVDPITKEYPELTPYQFASNSPIEGIDLDGLEKVTYLYYTGKNGGVELKLITKQDVDEKGNKLSFSRVAKWGQPDAPVNWVNYSFRDAYYLKTTNKVQRFLTKITRKGNLEGNSDGANRGSGGKQPPLVIKIMVSFNPIVSLCEGAMILTKDKDIYGNPADKLDKGLAVLDVFPLFDLVKLAKKPLNLSKTAETVVKRVEIATEGVDKTKLVIDHYSSDDQKPKQANDEEEK